MEFTDKQLRKFLNYLGILFFVSMFCMEVFYKTDKRYYKRYLKGAKESEFNGKVVDKYSDRANHNTPIIEFIDGDRVSLDGRYWGVINIGDSLSKHKGDYLIYVYRKDSIFTLNEEKLIREEMKSKGVVLDE